jgi:hypothetical protein
MYIERLNYKAEAESTAESEQALAWQLGEILMALILCSRSPLSAGQATVYAHSY